MTAMIQKIGFAALLGMTLFGQSAAAMSLDWSGHYRFEYTEVSSTTLADPAGRKAYILHNLVLSPRIIAADGIEVVSQFSVLGNPSYPGSQVGQTYGIGVNRGTATGMAGANSNVMGRNAGFSTMEVRQLYMLVNQEFAQITVGRAPIEFGLGMTYNAGNGAFDHWGDTMDLVAYKFLVGNLSLTPMIGKPYDYSVAQGRDVTDLMLDVTYNNVETESTFGVFYSSRTSSQASNDAGNALSGTTSGNYSVRNTNVLLARGWQSFKFKVEAGFSEGNTGLKAGSEDIRVNGYGIVAEMQFPRANSNWDWKLRTGVVSGDNPTTPNFEGYALNRNYDLAFLMFNHPLGGYDIFRSAYQRQRDVNCTTPVCPTSANDEALDDDAVSNTIFINPSFTYTIGEKWSWRNSFLYAQLQTNSSTVAGNDVSKDLGFEWDTSLIYKPNSRFQWVNQVGILMPGAAWKEGSVDRDANLTYGIQTKAAISF